MSGRESTHSFWVITSCLEMESNLSKHEIYERKTEKLVHPIVEKHGFEFVDVEYLKEDGEWRLRVYIDKEGGITIDDLAMVNRELGTLMEGDDFMEGSYILEVSSPGLLRPFRKDKDFERNIGNDVELKLYSPFIWEEDGKKYSSKELEGNLVGFNGDTITLRFEEDEETLTFARKDIALIRRAIDF